MARPIKPLSQSQLAFVVDQILDACNHLATQNEIEKHLLRKRRAAKITPGQIRRELSMILGKLESGGRIGIIYQRGLIEHIPTPDIEEIARFGCDLLFWISDHCEDFFGSEISEDFAPIMQRHGLLAREPYDPEKHGEGVAADPGDEIWAFTPKFNKAGNHHLNRSEK